MAKAAVCKICKKDKPTMPESGKDPHFCNKCWVTRLKQILREEESFHFQRSMRTAEAERYFVFHHAHEGGEVAVGVVFAMLDRSSEHLELSAFLSDKFDWKAAVPFIYEHGIESEVEVMDVFLGLLESELASSWRCPSWSAEVTLFKGEPFFIDSRDREPIDLDDEEDP